MAAPNLGGNTAFSFDTNSIPFIVNNLATCIISNERSLFPGELVPVQVTVDTVENSQSRQQYKEIIQLELVDDSNAKHIYNIPGVIYDPKSNFNLLGVSFLANFFQDKDSLPGNVVNSDSATVKSSGCCSHLVWDNGQHVRNFTHGNSALPKIMLYQGNGYFCRILFKTTSSI
jgi:hypothetical protein